MMRAPPAGLARIASNKNWILAKHLRILTEKLLDVAAGNIKRLIVTMPPRHGKSEIISKYFPAWYLMTRTSKIILASYEASFAASWGSKTMDVIRDTGDVFGVKLKKDSQKASSFALSNGSEMVTAGVGGPMTGKGGNLIIDDPFKNAEEALSAVYREKKWEWFNSTAYTRLDPKGWII